MPSRIKFIYSTTKTKGEALEISDMLINARLAACTNIIPGMISAYSWEGKLEHADECVLIIKTVENLVDEIIHKIKKIHSSEIPCILTLDIEKGLGEYMNWLEKSVR